MSDDLIEVANFRDYISANVAKSKLESEGIHCVLFNDLLITWNWFYSNAFGGVRVMVGDVDAGKALAVLSSKPVELIHIDPEAFADEEVTCPECSCSNVHEERIPRRLFFLFALLWYASGFIASALGVWVTAIVIQGAVPVLFIIYLIHNRFNPVSICANCGHKW